MCGSMNARTSQRLIYLSAWSPIGGIVWERLVGLICVSLLEEVCQLGCFRGFKMPYHFQLVISASYLWIRMSALRYSSNDMTTCCHDHRFHLSVIVINSMWNMGQTDWKNQGTRKSCKTVSHRNNRDILPIIPQLCGCLYNNWKDLPAMDILTWKGKSPRTPSLHKELKVTKESWEFLPQGYTSS